MPMLFRKLLSAAPDDRVFNNNSLEASTQKWLAGVGGGWVGRGGEGGVGGGGGGEVGGRRRGRWEEEEEDKMGG